jgi:molybdate transport system permease protein
MEVRFSRAMRKDSASLGLRAVAGAAVLFVALPLISLFFRAPWSELGSIASQRATRDALFVSLETSVIAAVIATLFGVPLAWFFARAQVKGLGAIRTICIVPMVLPPVVGGIALLTSLGRRGVFGRFLYDWWGISLPFTRTAIVIAQVFVAMPFLVIAVESAFRQLDTGLEDAARTLGASPLRVFFGVAVPGARGAIAAGIALAWARSLGEFGASITFAGSFPGRTQTLPMAVYELVATDYRSSIVMSLILVVISVVVLGSMRDRWITGAAK